MNITFLLGNGFDIGLGLNTGYESFYEEYAKLSKSDNDNIRSFKSMLSKRNLDDQKKIIDWADFEKAFGEHSQEFSILDKDLYIERFEDFVTNFNKYLENEEKRVDYSNIDLIAKTMNKAVATYYHIRSEDEETLQSIYNSADNNRSYNFISFNYTKTVDECAQILKHHLRSDSSKDVGKVLHIHGYIEENMIMGVNDPSQIINPVFANDQDIVREIVKPQQNSDIRSNYEKKVTEAINSSSIICIYGMSIGDTDKKWWAHIANWLAKSEKHALVILKYDTKYNKRFPFNQNKFIDSVTNKFLELSGLTEEAQSQIRSRIFVGMNHNVFTMQLCKKIKQEKTLLEITKSIDNAVNDYNDNSHSIEKGLEISFEALNAANK